VYTRRQGLSTKRKSGGHFQGDLTGQRGKGAFTVPNTFALELKNFLLRLDHPRSGVRCVKSSEMAVIRQFGARLLEGSQTARWTSLPGWAITRRRDPRFSTTVRRRSTVERNREENNWRGVITAERLLVFLQHSCNRAL
jgi:hypothetical protein